MTSLSHGLIRRAGGALPSATVIALALAAGAALVRSSSPWPPIAAAAAAAGVAVAGIDAAICVSALASFGLLPFVNPELTVTGRIPVWLLAFTVAAGLMLLSWATRQTARQPAWRLTPSAVAIATVALLAYTAGRLGAGSPLDLPSLSAPFPAFPLAALVTYLWLSHPQTAASVRRLIPLALGVIAIWAVADVAGSAGVCGECRSLIGTVNQGPGLLGDGSRLYTFGQDAFLGILLILFGYTLRKPSLMLVALTSVGYLAVALQASRAQYIAIAVGTAFLVLWRFSTLKPVVGALALLIAALVIYAVATGPIGARVLTAYQELRRSSGNVGYRVMLVREYSQHWTVLGSGVSSQTPNLGVNFDLGLPNTLLILGFAGALLQLGVLTLGLVRGVMSRSALGVSLAAVFTMVLVARPSLPLLEFGPSAVAYGMAIGFVAALWRAPRVPARTSRPRAHVDQL
jgi:hypothetical protein